MDGKLNISIIDGYINANRLTKKEFCKLCKISKYQFYKIMHGKDFNLISLFRIAKKMNLKVHQFFSAVE